MRSPHALRTDLVSCSDPLQSSHLGRRGAIFTLACLCIVASIGAASVSHNWWHLLICRAILGLGLGAKASVTPIFGAEVSPSHLRGMLVMNWQLFDGKSPSYGSITTRTRLGLTVEHPFYYKAAFKGRHDRPNYAGAQTSQSGDLHTPLMFIE